MKRFCHRGACWPAAAGPGGRGRNRCRKCRCRFRRRRPWYQLLNVYVPCRRARTQPGPATLFHKHGGVVVGAYGFYPYDTGTWLLGGAEGVARQGGSFTMVFPDAFFCGTTRAGTAASAGRNTGLLFK